MPAAATKRALDARRAKNAVFDLAKTDQHLPNNKEFDRDKQLKFIRASVPIYKPAIRVNYQGFSLVILR